MTRPLRAATVQAASKIAQRCRFAAGLLQGGKPFLTSLDYLSEDLLQLTRERDVPKGSVLELDPEVPQRLCRLGLESGGNVGALCEQLLNRQRRDRAAQGQLQLRIDSSLIVAGPEHGAIGCNDPIGGGHTGLDRDPISAQDLLAGDCHLDRTHVHLLNPGVSRQVSVEPGTKHTDEAAPMKP
jgi:hypothetical protein